MVKKGEIDLRDPNRIPKVINTIQEIWSKYPDLRFVQLVEILKFSISNTTGKEDLYYMEDEELVEKLEKLLDI